MLSKEEILELISDEENYRVERTISTSNTDKFAEAICAFSTVLADTQFSGDLISIVNLEKKFANR